MVPPFPTEAIAGQYVLHPGSVPAITGRRPILAPGCLSKLLRGHDLPHALRSLGSLFTLCAHAHQECAQQAFAVALGQEPAQQPHQNLAWLTARDHLRSVALDWPARLTPDQPPSLQWLRGCPISLGSALPRNQALATQQLSALADWLESTFLCVPLDVWLEHCARDDGLLAWCHEHRTRTEPAHALLQAQALHGWPALPLVPLPADTGDAGPLRALAHRLWDEPDFCQHPTWEGRCMETGPWIRRRHQPGALRTPLLRLASRLRELVELAAGARAARHGLLAHGAIRLSSGCGLAWSEMARGLLLHSVQLDRIATVMEYRVLAPTEWNFHPAGSLGQAVASLAPDDRDSARLLAAAFDPCVACL